MAKYREDAEQLMQVLQQREPERVARIERRGVFPWQRRWVVCVERGREVYEYDDIHHYWLESALVGAFCGGYDK